MSLTSRVKALLTRINMDSQTLLHQSGEDEQSFIARAEQAARQMHPPSIRAIGYWQNDYENWFPKPQSLVGKTYPLSLRDAICRYLDSGEMFRVYMGYSSCRFSCGISDFQMGTCDLSDGQWMWPEGLSHYIRIHDVLLPEEFIQSMADAGWQCPPNVILPDLDIYTRYDTLIDHEFWKQWSASHTIGQEP